MESILKNYGVHPPFHGKTMESLWKVHGIHLEKVWNLSGKSMESIHHSMESIHQKYGIHPPFHGIYPPKVWNPSTIPWNPSPILWNPPGISAVHPPFHGFHMDYPGEGKVLRELCPHTSLWLPFLSHLLGALFMQSCDLIYHIVSTLPPFHLLQASCSKLTFLICGVNFVWGHLMRCGNKHFLERFWDLPFMTSPHYYYLRKRGGEGM